MPHRLQMCVGEEQRVGEPADETQEGDESNGSSSEGAGGWQAGRRARQQSGTGGWSTEITWTAEGRWERGIGLGGGGWSWVIFSFFPSKNNSACSVMVGKGSK